MSNPKVGTDTSAGRGNASPKDTYKSKETPGWQKVEVPPKGSYKERKRSGTDVPVPPVLDLP